ASPAGLAAAEAVIGVLWNRLRAGLGSTVTGPVALCVGAAGATAAGEAAAGLADRLCQLSSIGSVAVCSDVVIAHAGALGGQRGITLVAGTGAVAFGIDGRGATIQVDGWGPLLGDDGGGGWIGLAGLRAALRMHDGRGPGTSLGAAASLLAEPAALPALLAGHPNPAQLAARFAPEVARLAGAGDQVAQSIMVEAARLLAESVSAAARRLAADGGALPVPVALTGGLLNLGPILLEPLQQALRTGPLPVLLRPPLAGPLDGARLLAGRHDTVAEALLHRATRPAPSAAGSG
ncbi:MAG: BadF/BadG/BcrA/BcrD ATPase family protein, partial [Jatrophihabitantaceae bacterium]